MWRAAALVLLLGACDEHGKSPAKSDAAPMPDAMRACSTLALAGHVRDFANAQPPGSVTFTPRDGSAVVQSGADGSFMLCGSNNGFSADVATPSGMLPGIAFVPVFGSDTGGLYHVLVVSRSELQALFTQLGQTLDSSKGQVIVHQVLGELQPTLGGAATTFTGQPPTWMAGNGGAFVMFANVAPGSQPYAPAGGAGGPSAFVPVEAGRVTYVMSLIVPD